MRSRISPPRICPADAANSMTAVIDIQTSAVSLRGSLDLSAIKAQANANAPLEVATAKTASTILMYQAQKRFGTRLGLLDPNSAELRSRTGIAVATAE